MDEKIFSWTLKGIVALLFIVILFFCAPTVVNGGFLSWIFGDKKEETTKTQIIEQIKKEISKLERIDDTESLYDFQVKQILEKYGTINYSFWTNSIKSITTSGGYKISIKDLYSGKIIKATAKQQYASGLYSAVEGVETPKLGDNMVGVYWSDGELNDDGKYKASSDSTKVEVTSNNSYFSYEEWYEYIDMSNANGVDLKLSRWANAKSTIDGSYFVWIPRFEYKISNEHSNDTGIITINFIKTSQIEPSSSEYKIHPAFIDGKNNYNNGEWNEEIGGFWVAKYEMSMEVSKNNKKWIAIKPEYIKTSNQGDVLISNDESTEEDVKQYIRAVSKPSCYAWNYISINKAYHNSLLYNEENQSHLIKNSEWGAIAYLTHSQYGRNGNKMGMNTYCYSIKGFSKITGYGGENCNITTNRTKDNLYDGTNGMNASTTGNIYGVYDLSGGNWEYVASSFTRNDNLKKYGSTLHHVTNNGTKSTKYITVYPGNVASITSSYDLWSGIYGDAIYEISKSTGLFNSWFGGYIDNDYEENEPFMIRGGSYKDNSSAGVFTVGDTTGVKHYNNNGYRVVLITE